MYLQVLGKNLETMRIFLMETPRKKHAKPKKGYKTEGSRAYLDQEQILGGKGMIFITPYSGGKYYFRMWVSAEGKYYKKSLRTTDKNLAVELAEQEILGIMTKVNSGHKVFGLSWGELCQQFLDFSKERVETNRITEGRLSTLKTQVNKWIIPYIGKNTKTSELDRNSVMDYGLYRRKKTDNQVTDITIRNEYTTINSVIKYAYRNGSTPIERFNVEEIKILEPPRRDTFTIEEYRVFYKRLGEWVKASVDSHETFYRSIFRDFVLLKSNSFMRFGEIKQLQWKMCKITTYKKQKIVELSLPKEICKNRKSRTFLSRGGTYLERIKKYSKWTKPDDFVFSTKDENKGLSKAWFYKYWYEFMKFSDLDKLEKKLSFYSLRHFGITARLYAKVNHYEVAKMAGTNVSFIEQHYEHLDMSKLRESAVQSVKYDELGFVISE